MHTLVAVMLTTLAAKLLVEGVHTLPKYCKTRGTTALGECPTVLSAMKANHQMHALTQWNGVDFVRAAQYSRCPAIFDTYAPML